MDRRAARGGGAAAEAAGGRRPGASLRVCKVRACFEEVGHDGGNSHTCGQTSGRWMRRRLDGEPRSACACAILTMRAARTARTRRATRSRSRHLPGSAADVHRRLPRAARPCCSSTVVDVGPFLDDRGVRHVVRRPIRRQRRRRRRPAHRHRLVLRRGARHAPRGRHALLGTKAEILAAVGPWLQVDKDDHANFDLSTTSNLKQAYTAARTSSPRRRAPAASPRSARACCCCRPRRRATPAAC